MTSSAAVVAAGIASGAVGLAIGSFLTVVVHRVPLGQSVVRPRSSCPTCRSVLTARDTIPVLSFASSRGRCRHCGAPISARYLALEIVTAACFVVTTLRAPTLWAAPGLCAFCAGLIALSVVDLSELRLPTSLISITALIGLPFLVVASIATSRPGLLWTAVACGAVGLGFFGLLFVVKPGGLGFGDVRLATLCATFLGWLGARIALAGFVASCLLGGVVALTGLAFGRIGLRSRIPFGPVLAAGSLLAMWFGRDFVRLWLG